MMRALAFRGPCPPAQQRILQAAGSPQFAFTCTPEAKIFLLHEGTDPKYGARHLKRAIERLVIFPLAKLLATAQVRRGDHVRLDLGRVAE